MGGSERVLTFIVLSRIILAAVAGVEAQVTTIEPCNDWKDVLTGCGGTLASIATSLIFGTLSGPDLALFAYLSLAVVVIVNGLGILAVYKLARSGDGAS